MSKIVLPYETDYVGGREAEKRRKTQAWLRHRELELASALSPLLCRRDTHTAERQGEVSRPETGRLTASRADSTRALSAAMMSKGPLYCVGTPRQGAPAVAAAHHPDPAFYEVAQHGQHAIADKRNNRRAAYSNQHH
jgi:hypothetical protein